MYHSNLFRHCISIHPKFPTIIFSAIHTINQNSNCFLFIMIPGDIDMVFKRIRDLREDNDFTQVYVAHYLCISQRYYSDLERGVGNLSAEHLKSLCTHYKVSADYILELSDNKYNK